MAVSVNFNETLLVYQYSSRALVVPHQPCCHSRSAHLKYEGCLEITPVVGRVHNLLLVTVLALLEVLQATLLILSTFLKVLFKIGVLASAQTAEA